MAFYVHMNVIWHATLCLIFKRVLVNSRYNIELCVNIYYPSNIIVNYIGKLFRLLDFKGMINIMPQWKVFV